MRGRERVGDGGEDATCFARLQTASPLEKILQTAPLHVLHDDVGRASGKSPHAVNRDDVGMVNRCRRLCLPLEAKALDLIGRYILAQDLQGYEAVERALLREKDAGDRALPDETAKLELGGKLGAQTLETSFRRGHVRHGDCWLKVGVP
jgi:hypothetical protein